MRGLKRTHLRQAIGDGEEKLARVLRGRALEIFQVSFGLVFAGDCFTHARIDTATRVDRDRQGEADGVDFVVGAGGGDRACGGRSEAARGRQVERGVMPGALDFGIALGDGNTEVLRAHGVIVALCCFDPLVDHSRLRRRQAHVGAQFEQVAHRFADDLLQGSAFGFEVIARRNFLRGGKVKARLRFVGVNDGGSPDFEIALGLRELLGNRGLRGNRYRE